MAELDEPVLVRHVERPDDVQRVAQRGRGTLGVVARELQLASCVSQLGHEQRVAPGGRASASPTPMNRSAASSSPTSTSACAFRCCHGRNAGSSTPSRGSIAIERRERDEHVLRAVLSGGEPGGRERLGGDMTLELRRLLVDGAHMRLGDRPVAASRRHVARRPVREGEHPSILGLDGQRDRSLACHHGAVPRSREVLGAGEPGQRQRRDDEQAPLEALRGRGLERRARRAADHRRRAAGIPSARAGRNRRRGAAPQGRRATGPGRHAPRPAIR